MNYRYISSTWRKCHPGKSDQETVNLPDGTIVSVGFQNNGYVENFYATQVFAYEPGKAFVQVKNTSNSPVEWRTWVVVASSAEETSE